MTDLAQVDSPWILIHSNDPPSKGQLKSAKLILSQAETTIDDLESQITELESAGDSVSDLVVDYRITLLAQKLDAAEERAAQMRYILSPWRRLLPEVFAKIFLFCTTQLWDVTPTVDEAPLLLLRVCRSWSEITLNTPEIWATLHYYIELKEDLSIIEKWLARSGAHPLDLHITTSLARVYQDREYAEPRELIEGVGSLFQKNFHRLRTLKLDMPPSYSALLLNGAPFLRTFEFDRRFWRADSYLKRDAQPDWGFDSLPSLRHLIFHPPCLASYKFPWHQLTSISLLGEVRPQSTVQIISQCPALVTCRLEFLDPEEPLDGAHPETAVTLLALQELSVTSLSSEPTETVLSSLTLPQLRVLDVTVNRLYRPPSVGPLLQRSACPLEKIHIRGGETDQGDIVEWLPCVSKSLTSLMLFVDMEAGDDLLHRLTETAGPCPNLAIVTLSGGFWTDGLLADMVESRWRDGTKSILKCVVCRPIYKSQVEDIKRLGRLRDLGLEVKGLPI